MIRATGEERALARATMYRLLALAFTYPSSDVVEQLRELQAPVQVAAELIDPASHDATLRLVAALNVTDRAALEVAYQRVFTLSYSEDCPIYETAFSAQHLFQQSQQQADISGFYRAFGLDADRERSDHLAMELEFCYLLAVKEAHARARSERDNVSVCRSAHRLFLRDHLARWAPLAGRRTVLTGSGTWYETAGELLVTFVAAEERYLRLGEIVRHRDEPVLIADDPGEMTCPLLEAPIETAIELSEGPRVVAPG